MFAENLKNLRKIKNITQKALADMLDVSQQAVAKWEAGKSMPEASVLQSLAKRLGTGIDNLMGLEAQVSVIGSVKAGYDSLAYECFEGSEPASVKKPEDYRYLTVKGDSMEPYIHHGDLALVRLQQHLNSGDLGVIIYNDGEATLKQYFKKDGKVTLKPFNPDYETVVLSGEGLEGLKIFGKVVETKTKWS